MEIFLWLGVNWVIRWYLSIKYCMTQVITVIILREEGKRREHKKQEFQLQGILLKYLYSYRL